MTEVHLAIYDLSRGMARQLSGSFLGPDHALDIIPHTGIVVFGKEYFFGGGIQSAHPMEFRRASGMFPVETQLLGRTSVTQTEFEEWCRQAMITGRYSAEAYDLMQRNCNNFSHDAAREGLRLPKGVPEWIIDVPQRFLRSPMGQMVRPMLEQMQVTGAGGGGGAAPFTNTAPSLAAAPSPPATNPWANIPASAPAAPVVATRNHTETPTPRKVQETPTLDSFNKPLLSNDTKTASVCAKKLIESCTQDQDKAALEAIASSLTSGATPTEEEVQHSSQAIFHLLQRGQSITFALMLLRLIVLYAPKTPSNDSFVLQCLVWIQQELPKESTSTALATSAARSMAWCTLSNAVATNDALIDSQQLDATVETALMDLLPDLQTRAEVRQAVAAFLYNVALTSSHLPSEELSDRSVSMICGCVDGIDTEPDATTQLRRLLVGARLVQPEKTTVEAAKNLINDLGFAEALKDLAQEKSDRKNSRDAEKVQKLATEFLGLLEA